MNRDRVCGERTCETDDGQRCQYCQQHVHGPSDYAWKCTHPLLGKRGGGYSRLNTTNKFRHMRTQQCLRIEDR